MSAPLPISDADRRARLVARHHLGRTAPDPAGAVRAVMALHSTDPATPHLSLWARVPGFTTDHLDGALLEDRQLWRLHAMRRTLFVVSVADAAVFEAAAARAVARKERRRVEGWLGAVMDAERVPTFLADLEERVLELLDDGSERRTGEVTAAIPELATEITLGSGRWTTRSPLSSRLLFLMAMDARIVRTRPAGSWRSSQYHWAHAGRWFDSRLERIEPATARIELARRYLRTCGPATLEDLRWWTGWTARQTADAVAALDTAPARLQDGRDALLLADDVVAGHDHTPHVALLPALDATPMAWKHRDWFLGDHAPRLFDRNGNIGPSVWLDGRVVGGWAQQQEGDVVHRLLEDVGSEAARRVAEEAAALEEWLAGTVVTPRFRTPLERELSAGQVA